MSVDWDPATIDTDTAKGAFVTLAACALVWLICAPINLYSRLSNRRSTADDDGDQSVDPHGANWSGEHLHNGGK